jgi:hypothetical protein
LANLTQPLEVFLQLGVPLGQQCQREINNLVTTAKARCTDLEFFKSLKNRMEVALIRVSALALKTVSDNQQGVKTNVTSCPYLCASVFVDASQNKK